MVVLLAMAERFDEEWAAGSDVEKVRRWRAGFWFS
jgi:hypothetical protein